MWDSLARKAARVDATDRTVMPEFASWLAYWTFAHAVASRRYIHSDETLRFLETVRATAESRSEAMPSHFPLFRAQPGHGEPENTYHDGEVSGYRTCALPEARMKPTPEFALEGRANPKGVLVLYLATHKLTAIAEIAHWSGPEISVARFHTKRPLRLVNVTNDQRPTQMTIGEEPVPEMRERFVWADINRAFSRPVSRSDSSADYVSTQILTELFRTDKYDGIAYQSSLGPAHEGHNIVLFDLDEVVFEGCIPYLIKGMTFDSREAGPGY